MEQYATVLLGYPNWWASIPMPIASFLEEYDFSGKTIIPFCSHGGGRFGQSLTAIAKLAPDAVMGDALDIDVYKRQVYFSMIRYILMPLVLR